MFTGDQMMFQCPPRPLPMERKWKSHVEIAPNCPRCASSNTKFCYYNNYSLSQPRYFCKGCRRYWTKGGSLRNVPVGGGCRKTRRAKSVRLSQNDHVVSLNYSKNFDSDSMVQENQTNKVSDIDLAVVFAKFLNQGSSFQSNEAIELVSLPNSLILDSEQTNQQKMPDLIQESDDFLGSLPLPPVVLGGEEQQDQEIIQELIENQEMDAFDLQPFIGDQEMVPDDLWCQEAANLSNVTWETTLVQQQPPQEFDSFWVDDQIKIPAAANFISDINSWSSFDPSGFEVFSRP